MRTLPRALDKIFEGEALVKIPLELYFLRPCLHRNNSLQLEKYLSNRNIVVVWNGVSGSKFVKWWSPEKWEQVCS